LQGWLTSGRRRGLDLFFGALKKGALHPKKVLPTPKKYLAAARPKEFSRIFTAAVKLLFVI
jgi:hypothetical protein